MKTTIEKMRSQWPDKLRDLKLGDTLYIDRKDLELAAAHVMVRNFEQRTNRRHGAQSVLYEVLADELGTLVTCIVRKRGVDISKRPQGFNQYSTRLKAKATRDEQKPLRAETKAQLVAATFNDEVQRLPEGTEACGILVVTYPDGEPKLIFVKDGEHHGHEINRIMKEGRALSVQSFAAGKTIKRKVSWES